MLSRAAFLSACLALGAAGCREDGAARAEADRLWTERCARCHGADGRGDGPDSRTLKTHPRNFRDAKWQAGEEDEELEQVILLGGKTMGYSEEMPPNPDLNRKPDVVKALVRKIREFGGR